MKYAIAGLLLISSVLAVPFADPVDYEIISRRSLLDKLRGDGDNNQASGNKAGAKAPGAAGATGAGPSPNAAAPAAAGTAPKKPASSGTAGAPPKPATSATAGTAGTAPKPATSGTAGAAPKPAAGAAGAAPAGAAGAAGGAAGAGAAGASGASSETLAQAAANWAKDTAVVSNFLNIAPTLTGQDFVQQAQIAYDAEVDELNHKAVLDKDQTIASGADVKGANATLVGAGAFQKVVDVLKEMVETGDSVAQSDTDAINLNRCANVLPNIDIYLAAAGTNFKSTRPNACDATGVKQTGGQTASGSTAGTAGTAASGNTSTAPAAAKGGDGTAASGSTAGSGSAKGGDGNAATGSTAGTGSSTSTTSSTDTTSADGEDSA